MKYVVLNLKMNGSKDVISQYSLFIKPPAEKIKVIICPPTIYLHHARRSFVHNIAIAAQDVSEFEHGEFTGQNSASMLKDVACEYVIIGHSETRKHFNYSDSSIKNKLNCSINKGLKAILCIGENINERKNNTHLEFLSTQLSIISSEIKKEDMIIAYEPIWAIGTGMSAKIENIIEVSSFIKNYLKSRNLPDFDILYGGSVNLSNGAEIINIPNINGVLVGRMSLNVNEVNEFISKPL